MTAFIEAFMSDNNQEVYWQGWSVAVTVTVTVTVTLLSHIYVRACMRVWYACMLC